MVTRCHPWVCTELSKPFCFIVGQNLEERTIFCSTWFLVKNLTLTHPSMFTLIKQFWQVVVSPHGATGPGLILVYLCSIHWHMISVIMRSQGVVLVELARCIELWMHLISWESSFKNPGKNLHSFVLSQLPACIHVTSWWLLNHELYLNTLRPGALPVLNKIVCR